MNLLIFWYKIGADSINVINRELSIFAFDCIFSSNENSPIQLFSRLPIIFLPSFHLWGNSSVQRCICRGLIGSRTMRSLTKSSIGHLKNFLILFSCSPVSAPSPTQCFLPSKTHLPVFTNQNATHSFASNEDLWLKTLLRWLWMKRTAPAFFNTDILDLFIRRGFSQSNPLLAPLTRPVKRVTFILKAASIKESPN